jgi:hypothetical protein
MTEDHPVPATSADVLAGLDLPPGTDGIPRLLEVVIWHVRNARAATLIITEENGHPAENWADAAARWDQVAVLAAELADRTASQASR